MQCNRRLLCNPNNRRLAKQLVATVCIGSVSMGISLTWTSPVLPQLEDKTGPLGINRNEASWIGSTLALGAFASAIPAGYLADHFGRRTCLLALVVPVVIFTLLVLIGDHVFYLYVARFFSGIATGGVSVIGPMYIGEISDVKLRGILGSFFEMLIYVGSLIVTILGAYLPYKTVTLILGIISVGLGVGLFFFPETPTYYLINKKYQNAEKALMFFRGREEIVKKELDDLEADLNKTKSAAKDINFWKLWSSKATLRGLVACVGLTIFQQLCAVDAVNFYCVTIFETAHTDIDPYTSSIIITITQLLISGLVVIIIEKLNRKTFLYLSALGTGVSLALMGSYFHMKYHKISLDALNFLPLFSIITFFIFFAMGLGPIAWLINSELFSPEIKGPANGITIASNWIFLFIVTKTFPLLIQIYQPFCIFYLFSVFMALCLIFIKFCVPETKGKTLIEIQEKLNR